MGAHGHFMEELFGDDKQTPGKNIFQKSGSSIGLEEDGF